jgi:glycosyltransferase involved in cell wall biosynthesis
LRKWLEQLVGRKGAPDGNDLHSRLRNAAAIASREDAVAITCWNGSHNPIGRAKVLYDIVSTRRPAVLFTYLFPEFGGDLWGPIRNSGCEIVAIPWEQRAAFHQAIRSLQMRFNTVWISKPRLPSFILAALVANDDARVVLDFDDDEEHFMEKHHNRDKIFAAAGIAQSRELVSAIHARTAASATLQRAFDARLVRHARAPLDKVEGRRRDGEFRIGFAGTAHRHKGLIGAAEAIRKLNMEGRLDRKAVLHVYGTFNPPELQNALRDLGAVTQGVIALEQLDSRLRGLDALLASYPTLDPEDLAVHRFQIPSKISDGLRLGLPVLAARWPGVEDLSDVPGVYLFGEGQFAGAIEAAMTCRDDIGLPNSFTLAGAYDSFSEALCGNGPPMRADQVFADVRQRFLSGIK